MHLSQQQTEIVRSNLNMLRIVCFALITGVVIFLLLSSVLVDWQNLSMAMDTLPMVGMAVGFICIVQAFIVPGIIASSSANSIALTSEDERVRKLSSIFQTKTIVGYALLEGAAFINIIFFFVAKNLLPLSIVAVALAAMVVMIPREDSVLSWIESRLKS